jgi:hypothetical protein
MAVFFPFFWTLMPVAEINSRFCWFSELVNAVSQTRSSSQVTKMDSSSDNSILFLINTDLQIINIIVI